MVQNADAQLAAQQGKKRKASSMECSNERGESVSMQEFDRVALTRYNDETYGSFIPIPTAAEARQNIFVKQAIGEFTESEEKLLIGYKGGPGLSITKRLPIWAFVKDPHNVVFYRWDLYELSPEDYDEVELHFPFSAIGFDEELDSCDLLKSYIAVLFMAATDDVPFYEGGESPVSVEAFRLASSMVTEELDKDIHEFLKTREVPLFLDSYEHVHQDLSALSKTELQREREKASERLKGRLLIATARITERRQESLMKAIIYKQRKKIDELRAEQHKMAVSLSEWFRNKINEWIVKYHEMRRSAKKLTAKTQELESEMQEQQEKMQKLKSGMQEQQDKMQKLKEDKDILLDLMFHTGLEERVKDCNEALAQQMWVDLLQESNSTNNGEGPSEKK